MTTSDTIAIFNIFATVIAVILAPVVALWIGGKLQERNNRRQQKMQTLGLLLSLRHQPFSPETFRALNLIDVIFVDNSNVREAWSKYYAALSDSNLQNPPGYAAREDRRRDLMIEMVKSLGLENKISTADLLRAYTPTVVVEVDNLATWERIKRRTDLRAEFIARGIGFPDFDPPFYPPVPSPNEVAPGRQQLQIPPQAQPQAPEPAPPRQPPER